jgi:hypothetical protein
VTLSSIQNRKSGITLKKFHLWQSTRILVVLV